MSINFYLSHHTSSLCIHTSSFLSVATSELSRLHFKAIPSSCAGDPDPLHPLVDISTSNTPFCLHQLSPLWSHPHPHKNRLFIYSKTQTKSTHPSSSVTNSIIAKPLKSSEAHFLPLSSPQQCVCVVSFIFKYKKEQMV